MKRVSKIFQPFVVTPKNATIKNDEVTSKSQKLLLETGFIRSTSTGCFALLPLATRVLHKLERLVSEAMEQVGAQRISLPTLTATKLWKTTGRLEQMQDELFHVKDRHGRQYILSPTHEEAVADLLASVSPISHKNLSLRLYQITSKFRDEMHPRLGVLRAREFLMMDAYSADTSAAAAARTYRAVTRAYREIFRALAVPYLQVEASNGAMGGTLSHEWHYPATVGEDALLRCRNCGIRTSAEVATATESGNPLDTRKEERWKCEGCGAKGEKAFEVSNGIEVGHTFILGDRYSSPLGATLQPSTGPTQPLVMGSYGIGLTRLMAASVETLLETETQVQGRIEGLRWPTVIAPYTACIVGPKAGSKEDTALRSTVSRLGTELLSALPPLRGELLLDDRTQFTIGKRVRDGVRTGYPYVIIVGKSAIKPDDVRYEVLETSTGETQLLSLDQLQRTLGEAVVRPDFSSIDFEEGIDEYDSKINSLA